VLQRLQGPSLSMQTIMARVSKVNQLTFNLS